MTKQMLILCEAKLATEAAQSGKAPTGKIEARVTTWGPREGADGRRFFYKPEGFMDWAKEFASSGRPLPMFVNHSADAIPVGEWTEFMFDDEGMTATGRLYMNTSQGEDLYNVMMESPAMFGGVSVGAYAEEFQWVKEDGEVFPAGSGEYWDEGYFQITKGGLREVSVVMYPNNPAAEVQKLEFFRPDGTADLKVLEKALREAGLSRKDAVTSASVFKKVLEQRDTAPATLENAPTQGDPDAGVTEAQQLLAALEQRELLEAISKFAKV
jgi:HK97 family phage prohead protease